jgi:hypothetical protein
MGKTDFTRIAYDLSSLLIEENLDGIDSDFSNDEISFIIKCLPNNHALGPDGFNGFFIKKSWNIIKGDFIRLLQ